MRRGVGQARKRACHLVDSNPRDVGPRQSAAPTSTVLRIVTSGRGGAARGGRRQSLRCGDFPAAHARGLRRPCSPRPPVLRTHAALEFHFQGFCWQTVLGFWCSRSFRGGEAKNAGRRAHRGTHLTGSVKMMSKMEASNNRSHIVRANESGCTGTSPLRHGSWSARTMKEAMDFGAPCASHSAVHQPVISAGKFSRGRPNTFDQRASCRNLCRSTAWLRRRSCSRADSLTCAKLHNAPLAHHQDTDEPFHAPLTVLLVFCHRPAASDTSLPWPYWQGVLLCRTHITARASAR